MRRAIRREHNSDAEAPVQVEALSDPCQMTKGLDLERGGGRTLGAGRRRPRVEARGPRDHGKCDARSRAVVCHRRKCTRRPSREDAKAGQRMRMEVISHGPGEM